LLNYPLAHLLRSRSLVWSCVFDRDPPEPMDTYLDTRYLQLTGPNGPFLLPPRCLLTAGYPASADRCVPYRAAPLDEAEGFIARPWGLTASPFLAASGASLLTAAPTRKQGSLRW